MRISLTTNLAFLKIEFDILKPVLGINSKIKGSDDFHYNFIDVDIHDVDILSEINHYYKIIWNHELIYSAITKNGYHLIYTPCFNYFNHLFYLSEKGLIDSDFFYYSFKRGFATLRISGKDIQIEYINNDKFREMLKRVTLIKYRKRRFPYLVKIGKEWYDRRKFL